VGLKEILDALASWAQSIISSAGYPGLVLVMFLENVFPPIPSEVVLPLAGSLALEGRFTLPGITVVGALGSVTGAFVFYLGGRLLGEERVREFIRRFGKWLMLAEEDFDRALGWFNRYGESVIFFGRMVPIVRSLVSIPAGIARMNIPRFTIYTIVGTALWSFLLALAGYLLGSSWPLVSTWIGRYEKLILGIGCAATLAFVLRRILLRPRTKDTPSPDTKQA